MAFERYPLYVNKDRRILTDVDGNPLPGDRLMEFYREEIVVLCFTITDDDGDAVAYEATDQWELVATRDFDTDTDPELLSEDDDFNIAGDWDDLDVAAGKVCCRVNTNTTEFNAAVGTSEEVTTCGMALKRITASGNVTIFDYSCVYKGIRRSDSGVPEEVTTPEYYTAAQTRQIFATNYQGDWDSGTDYSTGETVSSSEGAFWRPGSAGGAGGPGSTGHGRRVDVLAGRVDYGHGLQRGRRGGE